MPFTGEKYTREEVWGEKGAKSSISTSLCCFQADIQVERSYRQQDRFHSSLQTEEERELEYHQLT